MTDSILISSARLLKMSSKDMDNYIERWRKSERGLSPRNERLLLGQRRKITNREYAQKSRRLKKKELESYMDEVLRLREENEILRERLRELESNPTSNTGIKQELFELGFFYS